MALTHETGHVAKGLARLLLVLQQPKMRAWAASYLKEVQALEDVLWDVFTKRMLPNATGAQLDVVGRVVGQLREGRDDASYITWLQARILVNRSSGDGDTLIKIVLLVCDAGIVSVLEEQTPATVVMHLDSTLTIATPEDVLALLVEAKGAGVRVLLQYDPELPVFAFLDYAGPTPSDIFGDSSDASIGGTFSSALDGG